MKIIYHGHSFLEIISGDYVILIDPFISGNPVCDIKKEDIKKCDYIILTHGHGDHYGDTDYLAKKFDSTILAIYELAVFAAKKGLKTHELNIGGGFNFPFGRIKLTPANHSSSNTEGGYAGDPAGILLYAEGKTIYHAGDTSLFEDMKTIGETNKVDVAFLPIGDNYTMGIDDAVKASEYIKAETIVPIHYNTFEIIKADEKEFHRKIESIGKKCIIMKPGDYYELKN